MPRLEGDVFRFGTAMAEISSPPREAQGMILLIEAGLIEDRPGKN
jgi:hypothetical protein